MNAPIPVPNRTMAMQVTFENTQEVLNFASDYNTGFETSYADHNAIGNFVFLGRQKGQPLYAYDGDWVVVDILTGKIHIIHPGYHAQVLGLEAPS